MRRKSKKKVEEKVVKSKKHMDQELDDINQIDTFDDMQKARAIKTAAKCKKLTNKPYCVGYRQSAINEKQILVPSKRTKDQEKSSK